MNRTLLATLLVAALGVAACDDDDPTDLQQETFTATLTGAAERPNPVTTNASGSATVTFNRATSTFSYTLTVSNITPTAAHIHGAATVDQPAGVLVPLDTPTGGSSSDTFTANEIGANLGLNAFLALLRDERTYVNVHTAANPAGEIRGQLRPE